MPSPRSFLPLLALCLALPACARDPKPASTDAAVAVVDSAPPLDPEAEEAAHRRALVAKAREVYASGAWEGAMLGATGFVTSVLSAPLWPEDADGGAESVRLGYLRHGTRVPAIPEPIVNDSCPDGWIEIVQGGFVCGKNATLDPKNPGVRRAPHLPDLKRALPYDYGANISNGTPVYRRVLSLEDRKKYEPWLAPKPAAPLDAGSPESDDESLDAGATPATPIPTASADPPDAAPVPWFLRDGGSKQVTLDELHGRGVLVRRMVRGFVLGIDRDFKAAHAHWWRTTAGFAVPFERVLLHHPPAEFRGAWLGGHEDTALVRFGGDAGAPFDAGAAFDASDDADGGEAGAAEGAATTIGFVRSSSAHALVIDPEKKKVAWGPELPRRTVVELTDVAYVANGATYRKTTRGTWVSLADVLLATPGAPPADLAPDEKWIDVDLTHQTLIAFEGARPVFATLVSSGKRDLVDKTKDHPTPTGAFRIQAKHVTNTMDGDVAADAPYSIEDVPWVMYFDGSYALHGAFWHANFGHTMSHGCVNLSPADARALFAWTEPRLPEGWHGVFATSPNAGTRVILHE